MSWIDFKRLRQDLDFMEILKHYKVELKVKGERASAFCPLPGHRGKRRSPSFSADLSRGLFQCFGCGARGNILEFACLMENVDPQNAREFHKVAAKLQETFVNGKQTYAPPRNAKREQQEPKGRATKERRPQEKSLPVLVNPSLDFELKGLDLEHPYLATRGFTPKTVKHFGLGFCTRGSLKDRIAIPLHDMAGNLVGYAGRVVDDSLINAENPKYLFPSERERDGKILRFMKSVFLYNGWRIRKPVKDLVVVEGFPATWWLWQNGVSSVVGLMGSSCSKEQGELIVKLVEPQGSIWVFTDGDEAGRRCAASVFLHVANERFTRFVRCEEGKQPTDWTPEEILGSFAGCQEESGQSGEPTGASLCEGSTEKTGEPTAART